MTDLKDNFAEKRSRLEAQSFTLNPPNFESVRYWTHLLHEYIWSEVEMANLIATRPAMFDASNTYPYFGRFYTAVVTHCRPFRSGGARIPRLEAKTVFRNAPDLARAHTEMMNIRNNVIAHTGHHQLVQVDVAVRELETKYAIRLSISPRVPPLAEMEVFLKVITHTGMHMKAQMNRQMDRLGNTLGKHIVEVSD